MATKAKTFDCVQMKRKAQERLAAEYESAKGKYSCLVDFLNAKADQSELAGKIRAKIAEVKPGQRG